MAFLSRAIRTLSRFRLAIKPHARDATKQCVSDGQCCGTIKCHRYANRCQVQITAEDLMKQREKILGRRGKDY